jgi:hypothetical protein
MLRENRHPSGRNLDLISQRWYSSAEWATDGWHIAVR